MATVAINGLGRIGRAALKILLDADGLDLVAVNDIADVDKPGVPAQVRHGLRALPPRGHCR
jgi:glyceraldehyde-3-phosphate dehydrogenase/erythrose-4-phosphate dehydrogenase